METTGELSVGQIVSSKAGRDKDRLFVIIDIVDDQYVLIADGDLRKIEKPKKKKVRHLLKQNIINSDIKEKLEKNEKLDNIYLRRELEKLGII
ncbi:MAG: KOW domain-containing RNA-binding protein [Clostridia bacterium]|nr:KOW domain-containing RNA-binding protein [Clostridia bacterium]